MVMVTKVVDAVCRGGGGAVEGKVRMGGIWW